MRVKDVCSGCASWVEEGWSYCMHCGAARPVRRSSLALSTSLYSNTATAPVASGEKRSLRRRRQSSEEVGRQLQQWRRKSQIQEGLLQELERRNTTTQRAVAVKTESDFRRVVHDGRALVRNWPSSSASSSMLPMTGKNYKNLRRSPSVPASTIAHNTTKDFSNRERKRPTGNDVDNRSRSPTGAQAVYATVTREQDELYSHQQPSAQPRIGNIGSQAQQVDENVQTNTPPEERALPRRVEGSVRGGRNNDSELGTPGQQQASGWFWGAGGCDPGDGGDGGGRDIGVAAPGEGTMAAYWRRPSAAAVKSPVNGLAVAQYPVNSAADSTTQQNCSSSRQAFFGEVAATESPPYSVEHPLLGETSKISSSSHNSRLFVGVASAKAAVRSASNRAAELSHLLREGNNPPREECLAKAESAVRAAESAISCANERLFQLELVVASEPAAQEADGSIDGKQGARAEDQKRPSNQRPGDSTTSSLHSSSTLSAHIEELTEQLRLAQSLQAVSVTARARLSRRFALEAIAAVRLQALVRGAVSRWRERRKESNAAAKKKNTTTTHAASAFAPLGSSLSRGTDVKLEGVGETELAQEDTRGGTLPRTEELWWTPAEAESADAIGESESALLRTVVKLQAIVRSRLARSQTIAAVNARFVEHFDEEYQLPFYVCSETNTSQWNKPFGFASGGGARGSSSPLVRGVSTTELLEGNKVYDSRACSSSLVESADCNVEEMGPVILKAVVKLQAVVRSRVARSKTFAAVNARFAEHFDEEHQHPFYVCIETNSSQWNQPFGFGWTRGETRRDAQAEISAGSCYTLEGAEAGTSTTATANVGDTVTEDEAAAKNDCGRTANEGAGEQAQRGTLGEQEAAVTVIQCALRGARARAQLAEKILLASL